MLLFVENLCDLNFNNYYVYERRYEVTGGGHHIKIKSRRGVTCYLNVLEGREGGL